MALCNPELHARNDDDDGHGSTTDGTSAADVTSASG